MDTTWNWNDLAFLSPEIFLAVAGMVLLLKGAIVGPRCASMIVWAAFASFIIAGILLLRLDWSHGPVLSGMTVLDGFAGYMKILTLAGMALVMLLSYGYLRHETMNQPEYPVLAIFACLGMMLMISATNLLSLYVGLELQSLSIYVLAAFRRDHAASSEAGLKYFVLGALASGMLLFGISLIYGFTGTLDYSAIDSAVRAAGAHNVPVIAGMVFMLAALAFKISAVPFHMWTPDVYEGAPTSVTALMAIVPKIAAMSMLMRLVYQPFGSIPDEWQQIIWFLAFASMAWGAFAALGQQNIKRLMAYSSIGNMGYALLGIAAGTQEGAGATAIYLAIYMVMTAGAFAIILGMRRNGMAVECLTDLAGLSRTSPAMAYAMAILMFSMTGIPPMAGFFGKLAVFQAATAAGLYWLAVLGVVSSVVAGYYYLKIIKIMFFDEPAPAFDSSCCWARKAVLFASIAFTLFFIVKPDLLMAKSRESVSVIFAK